MSVHDMVGQMFDFEARGRNNVAIDILFLTLMFCFCAIKNF